MKTYYSNIKHLIFIILLFLNILSVFSQGEPFNDSKRGGFHMMKHKTKKIPRSIRKLIDDIIVIEGGSFVKYKPSFSLQKRDTNVLVNYSELVSLLDPPKIMNVAEIDKNIDSAEYSKPELPYYMYSNDFKNYSRSTVHSFYLSDHEVTNKEYREFTDWVTSSIARKILAKKYPEKYLIPKTSVFKPDVAIDWEDPYLISILFTDSKGTGVKSINKRLIKYPYYTMDYRNTEYQEHEEIPIYPNGFLLDTLENKTDYFEMTIFDDFPVVGVSWEQAMAYCLWKSNRLNEAILIQENIINYPRYSDDSMDYIFIDRPIIEDGLLFLNYRLPTSAELEYVASNDISSDFSSNTYMDLMDENGNFLFNFGSIIDENGSVLKLPQSDGALLTTRVKSYPSNNYGIYDIIGNVSEWVLDEVNDEVVGKAVNLVSDDENEALNKCIRYIKENFDTTNFSQETILTAASRLKSLTKEYVRKFGNKNNLKFVKGGSWSDSPMHLNIFLNNVYPAQTQDMKVGFRIARDRIVGGGESGKPQKYWLRYH